MKQKRIYIMPSAVFEDIDPDTGICTDISANTPDFPWDDEAKATTFIFEDEESAVIPDNMFGDVFPGDAFQYEINL